MRIDVKQSHIDEGQRNGNWRYQDRGAIAVAMRAKGLTKVRVGSKNMYFAIHSDGDEQFFWIPNPEEVRRFYDKERAGCGKPFSFDLEFICG